MRGSTARVLTITKIMQTKFEINRATQVFIESWSTYTQK